MIPKKKTVRVKGKALLALVARIYERDQHRCVVCGKWVEEGKKPHHEPCGAGRKSDEFWMMVLLCDTCHYKRHFTEEAMKIKDKIERYIAWMRDTFEEIRR